MNYDKLKKELLKLSKEEKEQIIEEISLELNTPKPTKSSVIILRREKLNNKQGKCPYCGNTGYVRYGIDKGSQRYKCKSCKRTFTEYTGTWLDGIHKKYLADKYIEMMEGKTSLDKIKSRLGINKKTAFDWRHKILSSFEDSEKRRFMGITESDETFFHLSEKGLKQIIREPRKRGEAASKRGISDELVAVIVTADRNREIDLSVATLGRIKKRDIEKVMDDRIAETTVLCSDGHVSYKGYAMDKGLEHHAIRVDLKQRVKQKIYHLQHVNNIDSRLKKWIQSDFNGVSTKYLQNYLNWFRSKELLKTSENFIKEFKLLSLEDDQTKVRFKSIPLEYVLLMKKSSQN